MKKRTGIFFKLLIESFRLARRELKSNLLRTGLSLFGVTVGIFAVIGIYAVVDSLTKSIDDSMSFIGERVIYVQKWPWNFDPDQPWWEYMKRPDPTFQEFEYLQKNLENHAGIAVFRVKPNITVKYRNSSSEEVSLQGITYEFDKISEVKLKAGRYFTEREITYGSSVVIVGANVADDLSASNLIGKTIKIKGRKFTVIGLLEKQGENLLGTPSNDNNCLIPYDQFARIFGKRTRGISEPMIAAKGLESDPGMLELENEIRGLMRAFRGLKPKEDDSFALNRPEMLAQVVESISGVMSLAGSVIGLFSILVGGFGIANIMFVSVKERTHIIGIQKSLGAKNYFILFQFLFEAVFLSFFGGVAGIFLVFLISLIPLGAFDIVLSLKNILIGFGIAGSIGVLSGIIPSLQAAKMDPVVAIRSK